MLCVAAVTVAACGNPFDIPPASISNDSQAVDLYALSGTPLAGPSAFNTVTAITVRVDRSTDFDFAMDIVPDTAFGLGGTTGDSVFAFIPAGALGFPQDAGLQLIKGTSYDSLTLAPTTGYTLDSAVAIDSGSVVAVSSRSQTCNFGLVRHLYAKVRVDSINVAERKVSATILTDLNCGYRGLQSGLPTN